MRKHLISAICLGLSMIGLWLWEQPVRAAGEITTVKIVLNSKGPVLRPEPVEINVGQSIKWVPEDAAFRINCFGIIRTKKLRSDSTKKVPTPKR
jgi:plastocyanin